MVRLTLDPACGMEVDPANAKGGHFTHGGISYSFCNPKCRDKFVANPERYLAPAPALPAPAGAMYICPMDPEVQKLGPGTCPKCGMALEPQTVGLEEAANPELADMSRRFWGSTILTVPLLLSAMSEMIPGDPVRRLLSPTALLWVQLALSSPVVLWGGWPFFQRGWASIYGALRKTHRFNMFTLVAIGTGAAFS